jgi:hypothetical protein
MRSFIICTLHQIFNRVDEIGGDMYHAWGDERYVQKICVRIAGVPTVIRT